MSLDFTKGPLLMGVINVTPDSFSDGGRFFEADRAIEHGLKLAEEGAHILDIGGESTRPGSTEVNTDEELERILPVLEGLKNCGAVLSVDTRHGETMKAALAAGAGMMNDVSALTHDPAALNVIAASDAYICLMHMQGTPKTMQQNPQYEDVVHEVYDFLKERIQACVDAGVDHKRIVCDPGIGFGKTLEHNLNLLKNLDKFHDLSVPVMLGVSRKSFIDKICGDIAPEDRLPGSLSAAIWGLQQGIQIFRVHDVAETRQAFEIFQNIKKID